MRKSLFQFILIISLTILICFDFSCQQKSAEGITEKETKLWPPIEPFQSSYLKVSDIHQIYYELSGNSEGKPVFFLHGGPGGSSSPYMRRFCNPAEVAAAVLYLSSDASDMITGANLVIDGGYTIR